MVTATTRVTGVIGDPVTHSLSPAIHNAAFEHLGLDWVLVALPVPVGSAATAVDGMRAMGIEGLSVTMPHKSAVIPALDRLADDATLLDAVNCISRRGSTLVGENTDGAGFIAAVRADFGFDPAGSDCVVLGAGGAARAVVLALARAGASSVRVVNRTRSAAEAAAALAGAAGAVADVAAVEDAALVVNATPLGMRGNALQDEHQDELPCDPARLGPGQLVADLIYHPTRTPWMAAAESRGARTSNGLSMLVHQAAIAFERWTGQEAPVQVMHRAVERQLERGEERPDAKS